MISPSAVVWWALLFIMLILFMVSKSHLLNLLLLFEFFMLLNLIFMSMFVATSATKVTLILTFFCASVCEACMGMGVLISMSRMLGKDTLPLVY